MTCPACGTPTVPGARFCFACGAALPEGGGVEHEAERRLVTVLFGDLSDFTSWSEDLDPERVGVVTDRVLATLAEAVAEFGGHVDKLTGDGLMAVFGAPTAHEDDAERAVRAAARMQSAVRRVVEEESGGGRRLGLRVGLNTGIVLAGVQAHLSYTVIGDTVNTAARLSDAAGVGAVFAGRDTALATMPIASWRSLAPLRLKGKREPVPAYELVGLRPGSASRLGLGDEAPMVGRDAELGLLVGRLLEVADRLVPRTVLLTGDAGVGKTRLAQELSRFAGELPGVRVLWGRCAPYGEGRDLRSVAEMVRTACGIGEGDDVDTARERVARTVARLEHPAYAGAVPRAMGERLLALLGLEPDPLGTPRDAATPGAPVGGDQVRQAVAALFTALAERRPAGARHGRPALGHAAGCCPGCSTWWRRSADRCCCSASAGRTCSTCAVGGARWWKELPEVEVLPLLPLEEGATERLLRAYLGSPESEVDASVREALLRRAQGNPFFLAELLHLLVDRGALVREGDRWVVSGRPARGAAAGRRAGRARRPHRRARRARQGRAARRRRPRPARHRAGAGRGRPGQRPRRPGGRPAGGRGAGRPAAARGRPRRGRLPLRAHAGARRRVRRAGQGRAGPPARRRRRVDRARAVAQPGGRPLGGGRRDRGQPGRAGGAAGRRDGPAGRRPVLGCPGDRLRRAGPAGLGRAGPRRQRGWPRTCCGGRWRSTTRCTARRCRSTSSSRSASRTPRRWRRCTGSTRRRPSSVRRSTPSTTGCGPPAWSCSARCGASAGRWRSPGRPSSPALAAASSAGVDRLAGEALRQLGLLDYFDGRLRDAEERFRQAHALAVQVDDPRGAGVGAAAPGLERDHARRLRPGRPDAGVRPPRCSAGSRTAAACPGWPAPRASSGCCRAGSPRRARSPSRCCRSARPSASGGAWRRCSPSTRSPPPSSATSAVAAEQAAQARERFAELGDAWGESLALTAQGIAARGADDPDRAVELLGEAVRICDTSRYPVIGSLALVAMGYAHLDRGDLDGAEAAAWRASALLAGLDLDASGPLGAKVLLAQVLRARGQLDAGARADRRRAGGPRRRRAAVPAPPGAGAPGRHAAAARPGRGGARHRARGGGDPDRGRARPGARAAGAGLGAARLAATSRPPSRRSSGRWRWPARPASAPRSRPPSACSPP